MAPEMAASSSISRHATCISCHAQLRQLASECVLRRDAAGQEVPCWEGRGVRGDSEAAASTPSMLHLA